MLRARAVLGLTRIRSDHPIGLRVEPGQLELLPTAASRLGFRDAT